MENATSHQTKDRNDHPARKELVDKAGTLTEGKPKVVAIVTADGPDAALMKLAASLEQGSEHPLAAAIVEGAKAREIALAKVDDFASRTGKGVTGTIEARRSALGNATLMDDLHVSVGALGASAEAMRADGQTVMFVALDGKMGGLIGVADPTKETSVDAIREFHAEGLRVVMLTGDAQTTASAVAKKLAIDEVIAGVLPDQKRRPSSACKRKGASSPWPVTA